MKFTISERHQKMFLQGLDVVGMSLSYMDDIKAFAAAHLHREPWLRDVAARMKRTV